MSETISTNEQVRAVRQETISVIEDLTRKGEEFGLPKAPDALENYHGLLAENSYKVLVVGEAKRGKSTFINALIGQDLLPTNVRVTTSQVFNVRPAEKEAYRLRFEDDSVREITREDLPKYGSQVLEDAGERPKLGQIIRWIEVDTPTIRFLPDGVSLLDTPGLGALYAAHAQVTHRFVPQADAVVFVLDSEKPIVQTELEFIEAILDATPHIFFIQTKIDQLGEGEWGETRRRNEQILEEKFGDRLTDHRVWPISSTLLLSAASGNEEDLEDSRQKPMEDALQSFLFRVAGWSRSAEAVLVADRYRSSARPVLAKRVAGLVEGKGKLEEIKKQTMVRKQEFQKDWGPQGQKRRELEQGIKRVTTQGKKSIREALQVNGRIAAAQKDKIEGITSTKEAEQLNETMPDEVTADVMAEWRKVATLAQKRCIGLLAPFLAEAIEGAEGLEQSGVMVKGAALQDMENKLFEKSKGAFRDFTVVAMATSLIFPPGAPVILAVAAVGGLIAAAVYGWKSTSKKQTRTAKDNLRRNLDQVLQQVRYQLLEVNMEAGKESMVDEYFASLERTMLAHIRDIASQKEKEAHEEHTRLVEAGKLDEQQRRDGIEEARKRLAEWDAIGKKTEELGAKLEELDKASSEAAA